MHRTLEDVSGFEAAVYNHKFEVNSDYTKELVRHWGEGGWGVVCSSQCSACRASHAGNTLWLPT